MKKSAVLTILVSLILSVFSTTAFAQLVDCNLPPWHPELPPDCMVFFAVQDRKYERGEQYTRVMIQFKDQLPSSDIVGVDLYDPDGSPITAVTETNARHTHSLAAAGNFTWCGWGPDRSLDWHWDWSRIIDDDWAMDHYFSWDLHDYSCMQGDCIQGDYTINVTLADGRVLTKDYYYDRYVDLPIVSLIKKDGKTKKKSSDDSTNQLNVEFLEDGSFVLRWDPIVMSSPVNIATNVYFRLTGPDPPVDGAYFREFDQRQPVELGVLVIPARVLNILQCDPDYEGYLAFWIQTRTMDNNNRTYSNLEKYYFTNTFECPPSP
jgi:hypothetical protein